MEFPLASLRGVTLNLAELGGREQSSVNEAVRAICPNADEPVWTNSMKPQLVLGVIEGDDQDSGAVEPGQSLDLDQASSRARQSLEEAIIAWLG